MSGDTRDTGVRRLVLLPSCLMEGREGGSEGGMEGGREGGNRVSEWVTVPTSSL